MKRIVTSLFILIACLTLPRATKSEGLTAAELDDMATHHRFFLVLEETEDQPLRYLYADMSEHLHMYAVRDGKPVLEWEYTTLRSRVSALFVMPVYRTGGKVIVVATKAGRVIAFDEKSYDLVFENLLEPFNRITCLAEANIDRDPQNEIILIDGEHLYVYDSQTRGREWMSEGRFDADEIILANVDRDEQDHPRYGTYH